MTTATITKVPLLDLQAQYEPIKDQVIKAFADVFESKTFILGPKVVELETELAKYCGTTYALGVSSGTDALVLALMALGIGEGDEVITSPFTFFATAGSIARVGAKPVFVDILPDTYNIDPALIEAKITPKTKAIMPVHIFGQMADMDPIMAIAKKHNLFVIEDAAQAIGSEYKGKRAGSIGHIGCFSFFPSKNLGACGDAGFVTTNDKDIHHKLTIMRVHGGEQRYYHKVIGGNFRIDAIQAAILLVKLPHLEEQHAQRIANGHYYDTHLAGILDTPKVNPNCRMIYNQYTLRVKNRDALQEALNASNIGNAVYYPVPLHLQECFADLGYKAGDMPHAEKATDEVVSIPIYSELTTEQKDYVIAAIKKFVNG